MQRRQGVCVSISRYSGLCFRWTASLQVMALLALCAFVCGGISHAQGVNTATLAGTVVDSSGAAVKGAKVTVVNAATGATRTAESDDAGRYNLVGLPPGQYKMSVDGGANFEVYKNESLTLTHRTRQDGSLKYGSPTPDRSSPYQRPQFLRLYPLIFEDHPRRFSHHRSRSQQRIQC